MGLAGMGRNLFLRGRGYRSVADREGQRRGTG